MIQKCPGSNPSQRVRLLDRRLNEAESRAKTLRRRVEELGLEAQGADAVHGSALAASVLSNGAMHPVDTIDEASDGQGKGKEAKEANFGGGRPGRRSGAGRVAAVRVVKVERVRR